jgi:hypothetical protein
MFYFTQVLFFLFLAVLRIELRTLHVLGKGSTPFWPLFLFLLLPEQGLSCKCSSSVTAEALCGILCRLDFSRIYCI